MWEQLQTRAKGTGDQSNLAGGMSYDHVKDRTSSVVGTEDDGGALFDETAAAYSVRRQRAQELLVEAVVESHRNAFYAYLRRPQWTTINEDPAASKRSPPCKMPTQLMSLSSRPRPSHSYRRTRRAPESKSPSALPELKTQLTQPRSSDATSTSSRAPSARPSSAASGAPRSTGSTTCCGATCS